MHHSDLYRIRRDLGFTQTEMGEQMGLSLRAYQDIETGKATFRKIHLLAAEYVALLNVDEKGWRPTSIPARLASEALVKQLHAARAEIGPAQ